MLNKLSKELSVFKRHTSTHSWVLVPVAENYNPNLYRAFETNPDYQKQKQLLYHAPSFNHMLKGSKKIEFRLIYILKNE